MQKNKILRLCSLLLVFSMSFSAVAQASNVQISEQHSLEINTVGMTLAQQNRFREVISLEANILSSAFSNDVVPQSTKPLLDFAGNHYTLIECQPSGYMIYHNASGEFVETSTTSPSPYLTYSSNLYYGGPTQYYVFTNGNYEHTVLNETYSEDTMSSLVDSCIQAHDYYIDNADTDILAYIETGDFSEVKLATQDITTSSEDYPSYITNAYCLSNCETQSEMSYFPKGACGYIAAALLILWYRETIDSTYLSSNNSTGISYLTIKNGAHVFNGDPSDYSDGRTFSYNLWRWHSANGQADHQNGDYNSGAGDMATTLESYIEGKGLNYTYDIDIGPLTSSIISKLDSRDRPYLLWGTGVQPVDESRSKVNHAVVVYGHWNGYLLCHFGWTNYNCSSVKGLWASGLMLGQ